MSEQPTTSVLHRMLAQDQPVAAEVPLTVARALRLSAARAAEKSVGLKLTVKTVSEELLPLDGLLERLSNELLLLKMQFEGEPNGIAAMDSGLVAAIVESQTMGKLIDAKPSGRPMTAVDASLAEPLVAGLMHEMNETISNTSLEGWTDGTTQKGQFLDLRQIGLTLPQETYRLLEMTIDLSVAEREGKFYFALPIPKQSTVVPVENEDSPDWAEAFPETVNASQAVLPVILHRVEIPLFTLEKMEVGQVLELPKCRVDRARLEMSDGTLIAKGRLGQMGDNLALRLETPKPDLLQELGGGAAAALEPSAPSMMLSEDIASNELDTLGDLPDPGGLDIDLEPSGGDLPDLDLEGLPDEAGGIDMDLGALGSEGDDTPDIGEIDLGSLGSDDSADIDLGSLGNDTEEEPEIDLSSLDLGSLGTD